MLFAIAIPFFVFGAIVFGYGFLTEWKQSRADGPVAIVATLPFAVASALYMSSSIVIAPVGIPWWGGLLAFFALSVVLGKLVMMADGRKR